MVSPFFLFLTITEVSVLSKSPISPESWKRWKDKNKKRDKRGRCWVTRLPHWECPWKSLGMGEMDETENDRTKGWVRLHQTVINSNTPTRKISAAFMDIAWKYLTHHLINWSSSWAFSSSLWYSSLLAFGCRSLIIAVSLPPFCISGCVSTCLVCT